MAALALALLLPHLARAAVSVQPVTSLPKLSGTLPFSSWSGYIDVALGEQPAAVQGSLFYWFIQAEGSSAPGDPAFPLVLWQTGGPGCSSMRAAFTENGPVSMTAKSESWSHPRTCTHTRALFTHSHSYARMPHSNMQMSWF
jgi:serine carboxypeptidase-like clade 1